MEARSVKNILINIAKNPLIIGVALGLICLGIRSLQTALFGEVVFALNRKLKFLYSAVKELKKEIVVGTLWRIVIAPFIGIGGAVVLSSCTNWLSCGVNEYPALIALFGSPVAVSSAVMAGAMGNDEQGTVVILITDSHSAVKIKKSHNSFLEG